MSEHELWNELGNLYFLSGAYGQAVHAYHRSIQLDDRFGRPYSNLALTYVQQGKFEEAVDLYRRSIELLSENKEKAISWNRLGNVYRYLRNYRQAVIAYQQADELDPENPEGRGEPGRLSADGSLELPNIEGGTKSSISTDQEQPWDAAFGPSANRRLLSPDDDSTPWALAVPAQDGLQDPGSRPISSLTAWGDPNPEDHDFDSLGPEAQESDLRMGEAEQDDFIPWTLIPEETLEDTDDSNRETEAISTVPGVLPLGQMTQSKPDPAIAVSIADPVEGSGSSAAQSTQASAEALAATEAAPPTEFTPGNGTNHEPAIEVAKRLEPALELAVRRSPEFVLAVREPRGQTAAEPTHEFGQEKVPQVLSRSNMGPEPTQVQAEEIKRDPKELSEIEAELARYERVVQINPRNARAWDALGNLYKNAGRYPEAILAYQQAISNDGSRAAYAHHLGLVYASQGRDEDAIGAFQRVIEIDPDHSLAHATLGGYYRKMGLEELAQKHIGKAMKNIFDSENEYNRACLAAICGRADEALDLLRVALNNKQTYVDWILRDPDLDFIRHDPRFKQLISDYSR